MNMTGSPMHAMSMNPWASPPADFHFQNHGIPGQPGQPMNMVTPPIVSPTVSMGSNPHSEIPLMSMPGYPYHRPMMDLEGMPMMPGFPVAPGERALHQDLHTSAGSTQTTSTSASPKHKAKEDAIVEDDGDGPKE
eukprot:gene24359-201_t